MAIGCEFDPLAGHIDVSHTPENLANIYLKFHNVEMYKNDIRFVDMATELAALTGEFKELFEAKIGTKCALLYYRWNKFAIANGNEYEAAWALKLGLAHNAEPSELLDSGESNSVLYDNAETRTSTQKSQFEVYADDSASSDELSGQEPVKLQVMREGRWQQPVPPFVAYEWRPATPVEPTRSEQTSLVGTHSQSLMKMIHVPHMEYTEKINLNSLR